MARYCFGDPRQWCNIMSFEVKLYTLSKRDNSTKRPAANAGTSFNCILKSGSGIMHPTLSFDIGLLQDPSNYNYAYIDAFDRYYFIEEWYFEHALWTATLKVDVLATYKTEIGNSTLYVTRAADEDAYDGNIIDTLYPAKSGCNFVSESANGLTDNPWHNSPTYIVGIVSKSATMGSLNYYALTSAQLSQLCSYLMTDIVTEDNRFSTADASLALQLSLVDPMQYIKSCVAIPLMNLGPDIGTQAIVDLFTWTTDVTGYKLGPNPHVERAFTFDIAKHPDTNSRGNYVNSAPYTNLTLTIPPFGVFDIDTSVSCNASTITALVTIDPITGKATLTVSCNGIILNRIESQLGVPISLSSVTRDYIGAVSGIGGAITGGIAGMAGGPAGFLLGAASGIGDAVKSLAPRANTIGTTGAFATLRGDLKLDHQFFRPITDDPVHNGRPACAIHRISTLSGYMIIQDGDVPINGTSEEDSAVRQYLESGFYYE